MAEQTSAEGEWTPVEPPQAAAPKVEPLRRVDLIALASIPPHMHEAIVGWVERGEPHPGDMGLFFHAVLTNDLVEAVGHADDINAKALVAWARLLYNDVPSNAWGDAAKLLVWYDLYHPKPEE